jgi:hypothetical protein
VLVAALSGSIWAAPSFGVQADELTTISVNGFTFIVPPPGHGVFAAALLARGGERSASVRTLRDGRVVVRSDSVKVGEEAGTPIDACTDENYALNQSKWASTLAWRFRSRSTPKGLARRKVTRALRRAGGNIVTGKTDCGLPDQIYATQRYVGKTSTRPNIGSGSNCLRADSKNVVGFGAIDPQALGLTCWWTIGGNTAEADMKLNAANYGWTTNVGSKCQDRWSVEAVATHEFGHAFGLDHVSPVLDANQTMSPLVLPCQNSQATLGRGDILGLRAKY